MNDKETLRKFRFHGMCAGLIGCVPILVIGLILLTDMSLFMRATAFGPAYLLPLLVLLSGVFASAVYLTIYYFYYKSRI